MGFLDIMNGGVGQMIGGAIQGAINMGTTAMSNRQNYKYNTKLMALQNRYNIDAWNRSVARDDYLLSNSQKLQKDALRSAGYSTADPNGTGVMNGGSTLQPQAYPNASFSAQPYSFDIIGPMAALAQLKKTNAEREGQQIDNEFNRDTLKAREQAVNLSNEQMASTIQQIDSTVQNINADSDIKREQKREIVQHILNLEAEMEQVKVNTSWIDRLNSKQLEKLDADISQLLASAEKMKEEKFYQELVNKFAEMGLFVGNDFMSNLQFVCSSGHGEELVKSIFSTIKQAFVTALSEGSSTASDVGSWFSRTWDKIDQWFIRKVLGR